MYATICTTGITPSPPTRKNCSARHGSTNPTPARIAPRAEEAVSRNGNPVSARIRCQKKRQPRHFHELYLVNMQENRYNLEYLMMSKLPLHLCDVGLCSCMFMVTSRNRTLFGFNFFVTLFGATLACVIPQTVLDGADPTYFRYYQYFGEHLLPIFGTVYMMIVHRMRPRYRDLWISVGVLAAMLVPSLMLNEAFPGSDYLFLKLKLPLLPDNQYLRAGVYAVLIVVIFHGMWFLWRLYLRGREKRTSGKYEMKQSGRPETES